MDSTILAQEVLKLPALERVHIIDALWNSLVPAEQANIDQAWLKESQDRLKNYRAGKIEALDGEKALHEIEGDLAR